MKSATFNEEDLRRIEGLAARLTSKVHNIPLQGELLPERLNEAKRTFRELRIAMRGLKVEVK